MPKGDTMESFKQTLKRFTTQNDLEIFGWLTVFLQNAYVPEVRRAKESKLYHCVYLLTHAIMQMVSESMFGLRGRDGTRFYLENFVDGNTQETRFSLVADEIHDARNVMAHEGYSSLQHKIEYLDDEIREGWKKEAGSIHINPAVYAEHFEKAFLRGAIVEKYKEQTEKTRTVRKYHYIGQWLRLGKRNPIAQETAKLRACTSVEDVRAEEAVIQKMIFAAYDLA
jgi:hypothetical protein